MRATTGQSPGWFIMYQTIIIENITGPIGVLLSLFAGLYLLAFWYRQEGRLYTDMPLMFGVTLIATALNLLVQSLTTLGVVLDTMETLRIRALLIGGAVIPMVVMLLIIWVRRLARFHPHMISLTILYWTGVSFLAPTEPLILGLLIPLLFVVSIAMMATFAVTWKTGRLTEVRSDLILLAMVFIFISQGARLALTAAGWAFVSDTLNILSAATLSIGLTINSLRTSDVSRPVTTHPMSS